MDALLIMILAFVGYIIMYNLYGKYIGRHIFSLSKDAKVPAKEFEDGQDYVPTKKEVIFGHHFTSIAGTGPIVGPAIAIIWGWGHPKSCDTILSRWILPITMNIVNHNIQGFSLSRKTEDCWHKPSVS